MWGAIISGVVSLVGGYMQTNANEQTMEQSLEYQMLAQQAQDAKDAEAKLRYDQMRDKTAGGVRTLQESATSDPGQLSPFQRQTLDESRRDTVRMMPKSLRGSGRTTTAMVRNVEEGVRNKMIEGNIDRKQRAATTLAGMYPTSVAGGANAAMSQGQNLSQNYINQGNTVTGATTANADVNAQTLASLGRIFAGQADDATRESRYDDYETIEV
jgi:hypothetical protein